MDFGLRTSGMDDQLILTAIARAVHERRGEALVVGGWVRDRLLGHASKDLDIEVFGIPAADLPALLAPFGKVEPIGQSFPVYKIGTIDIGLPRRESKSGRGHKGFVVEGDPSMSIEDAARRRDFTINAISWDPLTNTYHDPFHGREDLNRHVLRAVDPATFGDDSLRVLRALQFAARFELTLDEATATLCRSIPLEDLPPERVWGEIEKLLLLAGRPSIGFQLALDLGVIDRLFPELKALVGCEQEPEWHPEGDVWVHTLMVIDQARQRIDDLDRADRITVMLAAVTHDFGKPKTTAFLDGRIRSLNHEEEGVAPASAFLDRLNIHSIDGKDVRRQVLGLTAHHLKPGMLFKGQARAHRRRVPAARAESGPRAAGQGRQVRLPGTDRPLRLLRDGLVSGARARAGRGPQPAEAAAARPSPAGSGNVAGAGDRRAAEAGLREAARRGDHHDGRSDHARLTDSRHP